MTEISWDVPGPHLLTYLLHTTYYRSTVQYMILAFNLTNSHTHTHTHIHYTHHISTHLIPTNNPSHIIDGMMTVLREGAPATLTLIYALRQDPRLRARGRQ